MNNRMKDTFGKIRAGEELKERTKKFIALETDNYRYRKKHLYRKIIPAAACLALFLTGICGYRLFFTRTSVISIDINPSFELNINRFDKVIAVNSYNDEGRELEDAIDVRFMDYRNAIGEILNAESFAGYLGGEEVLSISVAGQSEQKSREILADIEICMPEKQNICCYMCDFDEVEKAHAAGVSFGRYRAFLELQEAGQDITIDDIKGLTMRQIRDLIGNGADDRRHGYGGNEGSSGNGHRHRHGRR